MSQHEGGREYSQLPEFFASDAVAAVQRATESAMEQFNAENYLAFQFPGSQVAGPCALPPAAGVQSLGFVSQRQPLQPYTNFSHAGQLMPVLQQQAPPPRPAVIDVDLTIGSGLHRQPAQQALAPVPQQPKPKKRKPAAAVDKPAGEGGNKKWTESENLQLVSLHIKHFGSLSQPGKAQAAETDAARYRALVDDAEKDAADSGTTWGRSVTACESQFKRLKGQYRRWCAVEGSGWRYGEAKQEEKVDRGVELELLLNSQATFDLMHSYLKDCAGCNPKMMLSTASRGKVTTRRRRASKVRM